MVDYRIDYEDDDILPSEPIIVPDHSGFLLFIRWLIIISIPFIAFLYFIFQKFAE
jgi:hypothetical protein